MGSGKGNVAFWVAIAKPGLILFEMDTISDKIAYEALQLAASKLPIKTKIIKKDGIII
jgi:large subunit ribosomal protein L16